MQPNVMDINRILNLNIPDIHSAYGGVRGKTMSAHGQNYAWPIIKDAGVHTIIDLRNDGMNQRMQNLCEEYGMEYFLTSSLRTPRNINHPFFLGNNA